MVASSLSTQDPETIKLVLTTAAECSDASTRALFTEAVGLERSSTAARLLRSWLLCANTRLRFIADPPRRLLSHADLVPQ